MAKDILLLHGALGDKGQFDQLIPLLSKHFKVHLLDFDGHGSSQVASGFGIDFFSGNVKNYLEKEQLKQPLVFGYSMGGYVALQLALTDVGIFDRILTLGTKFNWTPESANKEVKMLNPDKIQEKVPQFAKVLEQRHVGIGWQENMKLTAKMMLALGNGASIAMENLARIQVPVSICLGENDQMVSKDESEEAAKRLPQGDFHCIDGWQHPIEKIETSALSQLITELFR